MISRCGKRQNTRNKQHYYLKQKSEKRFSWSYGRFLSGEAHILAGLMKVMHDDRKYILSVLICKPVITVEDKKIDRVNNEIADQMVQLYRLICYIVVLIKFLMGFCRIMLHPN